MANSNNDVTSNVKAESEDSEIEMLDMLCEGEDEFDVDLMACGCRLAVGSKFTFDVEDVIRLFNLDDEAKNTLIGALVEKANLSGDDLIDLADRIASSEIKRETSQPGPRALLNRDSS